MSELGDAIKKITEKDMGAFQKALEGLTQPIQTKDLAYKLDDGLKEALAKAGEKIAAKEPGGSLSNAELGGDLKAITFKSGNVGAVSKNGNPAVDDLVDRMIAFSGQTTVHYSGPTKGGMSK